MLEPTFRTTRRRVAVAVTGAAAAVTAPVWIATAGGDQLVAGFAVLMFVVFAIVLVLGVLVGRSHQRSRAATSWMLVPFGVWLPGMRLWPAVPPVAWMVLVLAGSGVLYLFGRALAGPDPARPAPDRPPAEAVRVPLTDGERVVWSRSVSSRPALALAGLLAVSAGLSFWNAATGSPPHLVAGGLMAAFAVAAAFRSWARVRVGADGVRVVQPLLGRSLAAAPIGEIRVARAGPLDLSRLRATEYGVLSSPGTSGYRATRRGEALSLDLTGDREFLVTVPDAGTAAGLINAELDRQRGDRAPEGSR